MVFATALTGNATAAPNVLFIQTAPGAVPPLAPAAPSNPRRPRVPGLPLSPSSPGRPRLPGPDPPLDGGPGVTPPASARRNGSSSATGATNPRSLERIVGIALRHHQHTELIGRWRGRENQRNGIR